MSELMPQHNAWYPYGEDEEPVVFDTKNPRPYTSDPNSPHMKFVNLQLQREQEFEKEFIEEKGE